MKIPINYDLTMEDNVKILADWLKTYNQKYDIHYVIMYHAAKFNIFVIEQGLLAGNNKRKNFGTSENGYVYLATTPKMAEMFGSMAHNGKFVIYEVLVPIGKLLPDKGRLKYTIPDDIQSGSLAHSLIYAGSAKIKGNIERWQIKRYEEKNRSEQKKLTFSELLQQKADEAKKHISLKNTQKTETDRS